MNSQTLLLNCFNASISPNQLTFPYFEVDSWEASTESLQTRYSGYSAYRIMRENEAVQVLLLNGPETLPLLPAEPLNVNERFEIGKKIILRSLVRYFVERNLRVRSTKFETSVIRQKPDYSYGLIDIHQGIRFQVRHPFSENRDHFSISVQWDVTALFNSSLANTRLASIAKNRAVLFKPVSEEIDPELKAYRNRYLGRITDVNNDKTLVVECKDGVTRQFDGEDLFLEASPAVIRIYEQEIEKVPFSRSAWYKIQELSFVLREKRRNIKVLKDRLDAIRSFIALDSKEHLLLRAETFESASVVVDLNPISLEVN